MAGFLKPRGNFSVTPHKVSVCILPSIYEPPGQISVPFPFSSVAQHNRLGCFCRPSLRSVSKPVVISIVTDDLFNFVGEMRGILGGPEVGVVEDDQVILDPNSNLGMFLHRCVLAFNLLSFEEVVLSSCPPYDAPRLDYSSNDLEVLSKYENMDLETLVFEKADEEIEASKRTSDENYFHLHVPKALSGLVEGNAVLGPPYALASLSFCHSFNLDLLIASAVLTLAELWLSLGSNHANRALSLIHGVLPSILGHGGLELRACAYIVKAKCFLSDPNFSVFKNSEVVLDPVSQASDELQVLEYYELAAEAFYLKATVFDKLGRLADGKRLQLRSRNT